MMHKPRGFACMNKEKQLAACSKGGRNVPATLRSYSQNRELAVASGKKGGKNVAGYNRTYYKDRNLAKNSGKKGGKAKRKTKVHNETT